MTQDLLERTSTAAELIRKHADDHEKAREIGSEAIVELKSLDILRAYVPAAYGGPEFSPQQAMRTIEILSAADGSTGWCATIASLTSHIAGCLDADVGKAIFGSPDAVICGAYARSGRGEDPSDRKSVV